MNRREVLAGAVAAALAPTELLAESARGVIQPGVGIAFSNTELLQVPFTPPSPVLMEFYEALYRDFAFTWADDPRLKLWQEEMLEMGQS